MPDRHPPAGQDAEPRQVAAVADLVVSADGPLSVQCDTCKAYIGGTTYPITELHLRVLIQLRKSHKQACGKTVPRG